MNLAGWRFVLFALVGSAAIVLLASIGVPTPDAGPVNRHTGERGVSVRNAADALHEARTTGNARIALEKLRKRIEEFSGQRALLVLEAVLTAELTPTVPPFHPAADAVEQERALALRARAPAGELYTRARERDRMPSAALVALLTELEADEHISAATEELFAPLARWNPDGASSGDRPDEFAARVRAYLGRAETLGPEDEELLIAVIRAFRAQVRPRARLRWALRGFGLFPGSRTIVDELTAAYLEQPGRQTEAFLVVGAALNERPDDVELWKLRARLAGWASQPEAEARAREKLLTLEESREHHERLIILYRDLGRPGDAVEHAEALVRDSTDRKELLRPALLALDAGQIDRALAMLEARAETSDDPAWWRERIIEFARQDLREDRVVRELNWLRKRYPDRDYDARLEGVLRRRGRHAELADLLEERLGENVDEELERELILLRAHLGQHDKALALLERQSRRIVDPKLFFTRLPVYATVGVEGIEELAMRMAASPMLGPDAVPEILGVLEPLARHEAFGRVALVVARRYPRLPESRDYLIRRADAAANDPARAAAMAELAREHLDDADYVGAWAERAGWAGDLAGETKARERLLALRPGDVANRRKLADLYDAQNLPAQSVEQWRYIAAREGIESPSQLRLIDALMANDELDEAMAILERRARMPNASLDDQLHVAEELFGKGHFDRATRFYGVVLEKEPRHELALLRQGLIRAWTNDPRGAIPFLEQRLAVSEEQAATVQFTLGECHWAIGEPRQARQLQEMALRTLLARPERSVDEDVMVAKMLARFGRFEEASPIFERVVAAQPDNVDLALDYADSMLATGRHRKARELVDAARAARPQYVRAVRLDGMLALREKRYGAAAAILSEAIERFGPDAGTMAELGRARELSGDFDGALAAYRRSESLQPGNRDLEDSLAVLEDRLSRELHVQLAGRRTGDDTFLEMWGAGTTLWKRGRTRLGAALGYGHYEGPANVVNGGATDVKSDVARFDLALTHRFRNRHRVGGGVEFFPGADGNTPVSFWAGFHLVGEEPYWTVRGRGWWNELFDNPAAAAGLGGRTSGGAIEAELQLPARFWIGSGVRYEQLSLEFDGIEPSDPRVVANATVGWRALDGALRVGAPLQVESALMPGVVGARLPKLRPGAPRNALSIWFNAATYRLLGDAELATIIPLGERFDYLTFAARYDRHLADELGLMVEGYVGRELQESKSVYGIAAGLGWRPKQSFELAFVGAYGSALGRAGDEDTFSARLGLTWRW